VPLAIEFAAARARALPIRDLRQGLADHAIDLSRPPDSHAREPSVDGALRISWEGLPANLQRAMAALAILGSSFSFTLARVVLGPQTPDVLTALVAHGMLQFDGATYRILRIVLEFVRERDSIDCTSSYESLDRYLATFPLGPLWERRYSDRKELQAVSHLLPDALLRASTTGRPSEARAILLRMYAANGLLGHSESHAALCAELIESATGSERAQLLLERANLMADSVNEGFAEAIDWAHKAGDPCTEIAARMRRGLRTGWCDAGDMQALMSPPRALPPLLRLDVATWRYIFQFTRNLGCAQDRLAELDAEIELSGGANHLDLEVFAECLHAHALIECNRYEDALVEFERSPALRRDADAVSRLSVSTHYLPLLSLIGQPERAHVLVVELLQIARRCGHTLWLAMMSRLHARIKAELGSRHAALVLADEAVRIAESCLVGQLWSALRDQARIALLFDRIDVARTALVRAETFSLEERAILEREQLILQCDLREAFELVDGERVAILNRQAASAGPRPIAISLALEAWWLAGNGKRSRAREVMASARAAVGPAQGLERQEIERIGRAIETDDAWIRPGTTPLERTAPSTW